MSVRVVFFDYGGTLAYSAPSAPEIMVRLLAEHGLHRDPEQVAQAMADADARLITSPSLVEHHGKMPEFWRRYNGLVLDRLGISDPEGRLAGAIHEGFNRPDWYHRYPEAAEALETLRRQGFRLGIISNNVDAIRLRLQQLDLGRHFDTVTYSQEAGADKPDRAIFALALRRAGCVPAQAVHVGDSYEADVVGARSIGITPVLIDRDQRYPDADCWRIGDLRELVPLLRLLTAGP